MANQNQIREQITNTIIAALESGSLPPWRRPWRSNNSVQRNIISKRAYRGLNPILLDLASQTHGFTSHWWGTFQQIKNLKGRVLPRPSHVPPGRWGTQICFWTPVTKTDRDENGDETEDRFFVLRMYTIFNADQTEGLAHLCAEQAEGTGPLTIDYLPAEEALEAATCGMGISLRYGGGRAFYDSKRDCIQMPSKATFESLNEYYATAFHECVHATEHPSRLDWSRKIKENSYGFGELIAELGGVYVCRELNVPSSEDLSNHTAYLASWLRGMKGDPRFIFLASAQASKAASYILDFSRKPEDVPEQTEELVQA